MSHLRWLVVVAISLIGLASCGGDDASTATTEAGGTPAAGDTTGGSDGGSDGNGKIDLTDVDWCGLLTEADVQEITGSTEPFVTQSRSDGCFWAVPKAGFPEFLDVTGVGSKGLDDFSFTVNGVTCPASPVAGVGEEAVGGTCNTPAKKVYLAAYQDGAKVMVEVNEPKKALTPEDLVSTAQEIYADL